MHHRFGLCAALLVSALLHGFATPVAAAPLTKGGEIIVKFRPGASQGAISSILADLQATPLRRFGRIQVEHNRIGGRMSVADAIARYKNHPAIQFIEPNYIVSINRTPDDPRFPELWGLRNTGQTGGLPGADISATEAWDTSTGSTNVIVGVIDTGIDYSHPDLAGNIYTNTAETPGNGVDDDGNGFVDDVHGWDFFNQDNDPMDDHGHGTHVAGTVGAIGNNGIGVTGVSWSVRLMPLKFLGSGGSGSTSDAIAAIEYATQMGVDIMSNSWGGGGFSEALRLAIVDASDAGIFFVAAAGNEGSNNDIFFDFPSGFDVPNVISVAATDHRDQLADFSNYGATSVDLAAPGVNILSTLPSGGYGLSSGTSMATPHVSGVLALILAQYPRITLQAGRTLLLNSVDQVPGLNGRVLTGGRLNAIRALEGPDSIAPSPVLDLAALGTASNRIPLQWTATGDDGMTGTVTSYEIRYATFEITEGNFDTALPFHAVEAPQPPGSQEQIVVTALSFSTTYYFALKALDEYGNRSTISNVVSGTTLGPPEVEVSPTTLSAALLTGATATRSLTLSNPSAGTLDFSLHVVTASGGQWLSTEPKTGTVPPGGSVVAQVTFNASGLFGGGYDALIQVLSNDPDEAAVPVIAHLDVTAAPDIALSTLAVDYGTVFLGYSRSQTIQVTNNGADLLTVTGVAASLGDFTVAPDGFSLAPGASHDVIVAFSPLSVATIDGLLTIASNDPDERLVTVTLHGDGLIAPDIGVVPSMFTETLTTGQTATTVMTVRNTGGSNLTFGVRKTPGAAAGAVGSPVSVPSSLNGSTLNQTNPEAGPPSIRAEYEGAFLRFGITEFGEIMPFQSPVGNEHLAEGTFVSGYTLAYVSDGIDRVSYSVHFSRSGIEPVSYRELENTPSRILVEVVTRTSDRVIGIRRVFTFLRAQKYVEVTTELQNLSASPVTQVVLKEDIDWDVDEDFLDDRWDYDRSRNMVVAWDQHYVAVAAAQTPDVMDINGWSDFESRATTVDFPSGPVLSFDGLEVLHFELGALAASERRPVRLAYGVASTLEELQDVMNEAIVATWLSVTPDSGVLPPGGSADLAVAFHPGALPTGDYTAQVVVDSNDPDEPEVVLPASLHLTGVPDLAVSPAILDFGLSFLGQVVTRTLQVTNFGTSRLEVTGITPGLPVYAVNPASLTLEPLESRDVAVTFSTTTVGIQNSTLTITSNDPDEGAVIVPLHGEGIVAPDIDVTPGSLSADLLTGEATSRLITIRNTGGSDLTVTVAPQAAAPAAATVVALRTPGQDPAPFASALATGATTSLTATAVPGARAVSTPLLAQQNSIVPGSSILVLANAPINNGLLRALRELGYGYEVRFTDEFTGIDFTPYHSIVVAMDGGPISEASCQALANAAAGGRLLFMVGGTNYPPFYNGVQGYLLSHTGEAGWKTSASPHLTVVDPMDQLATGLPPSHSFTNFQTSFYMLRVSDPAARVAVRNGDNHPALVQKTLGSGTLVYFINPPDDSLWENSADFAILKQIVRNTLLSRPVRWLSVEPGGETVPPGGSIDVQVRFDASGVIGGGYDASIRVASNDPDETEVLVAAHLDVTGVPDITLPSVAVDYGTVFLGVSRSATVVVRNDGTDLLTVSSVAASPGDFNVAPGGFSLAPGESHDVSVTFSPLSAAEIEGLLTIASDDPDEGVVTVTLHGEGLIAPDIDVTPVSLSADLQAGETTSRLVTIRNTGGSSLTFTVAPRAVAPPAAMVVALETPGQKAAPLGASAVETAMSFAGATAARIASGPLPASQNSIAAGNGILVLTNAPIDGGLLRALRELGHGYDLMFTSNYVGIDFTPYHTIVVAMDGDVITEASCQALANAAIGGRLLFMIGGTSITSYYNGVQTYLLSHTGEIDWTPSTMPHLRVANPLDPLATGLPPTHSFSNPSTSQYMLRISDPAARVAVRNGDSYPALVLKPLGTGTLVYYVNPPDDIFWASPVDFAILKQITQNALQVGTVRWLSVEPGTGAVAPGGSVDVQVTFDASGLLGGGYEASIRVASNDPDEAEVAVPAHLNVTGIPVIAASPDSLDFGSPFVGQVVTRTLHVTNSGTGRLEVTSVTPGLPDYAVDRTAFALNPLQSRDVMVTFSATTVGIRNSTLTIASNGADPEISIALVASALGDDPPVVAAPATATGAEGAALVLGVTAADPEGDVMYSLTAAPLPTGATFVANATNTAGELQWTPDYDQAGPHTVTISATSARHAHPVSGPLDLQEGSAIVTISITNTDRAPIVTAPATQTIAEGALLTFIVTAADPDGDPVATLEVGEIPVGSTYTPDPGLPRGTFTWTPTFASAGTYNVTFTATNVLSGSATTAITVTDQNRAPIANTGGPYIGMTGVPIAFDGSRSSDPDGEDLEFTWNFGDGDTGSGPTPSHVYTSMTGSPFPVALTVSDGTLSNTATTTATVQSTVAANVFFAFNLNYIFPQILPALVRVEPIAGSFDVHSVILSSVTMSYGGTSILAKCKSVVDGDRNHNGVREARICFARNDLKTLFASLPNGTSNVEITLEGNLMSGGSFRGSTMVHVIKFGFLGSGALAQVSPNPLNPQATLTFVTTEPGPASAQLFDLHGRLVRDLLPRQYFMPGAHQVMIDGRNDQGSRLASGVYYYRVQSVTGVSKGAITVLK